MLFRSDHAIRIVDDGKIPDGEGGFRPARVVGRAGRGEKFAYISTLLLGVKEATIGPFAGTGKDATGLDSHERNSTHEIGHNLNLTHPTSGTADGNLMHQGVEANGGKKITGAQIRQIVNDYRDKKINTGRQGY